MIERERWIVYPLLLLALGASLREKFVPPQIVEVPELKASRIVLVDEHERPRIVLRTVAEKTSPGTTPPPSQGQIELLGGPGEGRPLALIGGGSLLPEVLTERLVCDQLIVRGIAVADEQKRARVIIGSAQRKAAKGKSPVQTAGFIKLLGRDDQPTLMLGSSDDRDSGELDVFGRSGLPAVSLRETTQGGIVIARHAERALGIALGNLPNGSGLFAGIDKDVPLTALNPEQISKLPKLELPPRRKPAEGATGPPKKPPDPAPGQQQKSAAKKAPEPKEKKEPKEKPISAPPRESTTDGTQPNADQGQPPPPAAAANSGERPAGKP